MVIVRFPPHLLVGAVHTLHPIDFAERIFRAAFGPGQSSERGADFPLFCEMLLQKHYCLMDMSRPEAGTYVSSQDLFDRYYAVFIHFWDPKSKGPL